MEVTVPVNLTFVLAKIHGMRSRMYEREALEKLLGVRNVLEMMRTVRAGEEYRSHREFERGLVQRHVAELTDVTRQLRASFREVTESFLRRYQAENLKVILRGWVRQTPVEQIKPYLIDLPERMLLPVEELLASSGVAGFLGRIPSRVLAEGARLGVVKFAQTKSTFFMEAGIDRAWLGELLTRASALHRPHRAGVLRLAGLEVDQYQVMFVLRSRINYDVAPEELREYLLGGPGTRVSLNSLMELASLRNAGEMLAELRRWRFLTGGAWRGGEPGTSPQKALEELQAAFERRLYDVANSVFYCEFNLSAVLAFFYLKRTELANLIVMTEALRYDIPRPETATRMVGSAVEE